MSCHPARVAQLAVAFTALTPTLALLPAIAARAVSSSHPATVLPADTAFVLLLDTRPETWAPLSQYALFQQLAAPSDTAPNLGGLPFLPAEVDYGREIAPWIGEVATLAQLPLARPRAVAIADYQVMVAPVAQPENLSPFMSALIEARGASPEIQSYQNIDIQYWPPQYPEEAEPSPEAAPPEDAVWQPIAPFSAFLATAPAAPAVPPADPTVPAVPGLAIAVLPNQVIAAQTPVAIRRWLDQRPAQAADSLAASPRFQRTLSQPAYDRALGAFHGNLAELVKFSLSDFNLSGLPLPLPSLPEGISPEAVAQLASSQLEGTLEALLYPQAAGVRARGRLYYDGALLEMIAVPDAPASADGLAWSPAASYLALSGQDLHLAWRQTRQTLSANDQSQRWLQRFQQGFQRFTGLELGADILSWMDGNFAIFLFPTRQTPLTQLHPSLQIGLGLAVETSDRPAAEAALTQLNQRLGEQFLIVESFTAHAQSVTGWRLDGGGRGSAIEVLGYSWVEEDTLLLTTSAASLSDILNFSQRQRLPSSPLFQRAIADFPAENQGYFYANISSTLSLVFNFLNTGPQIPVPPEVRRLLGSLQSASATVSTHDEYLQVDSLLMLTPAQE